MAAPCVGVVTVFVIVCLSSLARAHVVELDDRFNEARKSGKWLVEFYAPWCGHCQRIQPIWSDVGEKMKLSHPHIHVSRLDGTRYGGIMDLYGVKGFPTIMYIEGERVFTHRGGRTSKDIINFAVRAEGPAVRKLEGQSHLRQLQRDNEVIFVLVAEDDTSDLEKHFTAAAEDKILDSTFVRAAAADIPEKSRPSDLPALLVFKDGTSYRFDEEIEADNISSWILQELIPAFPLFTSDNIFNLFKGGKALVIVLTHPSAGNAKKHPHYLMREVMKEAALKHRDKYHKKYQFVYMEDKAFMQELVLTSLEIPNILVFEPKSYLYYLMEDPVNVNQESLETFLKSVEEGLSEAYGGNSFFRRIYRVFYEIFTSLAAMWTAQPILTTLLLGLPSILMTFVCYSLCTAEPAEEGEMDSEDEGEEGLEYQEEGQPQEEEDDSGHIKAE